MMTTTDDFIELDMLFKHEDSELSALGIKTDADQFVLSKLTINKKCIEAIHPYDFQDTTLIYLANTGAFIIKGSYEEVLDLIFNLHD